MSGEYGWWLFVAGLAIGAAVVWLLRGSLRRQDDDEAEVERRAEATWIGDTIEDAGGIAPVELVEQILQLHREYLAGSPLPEATYVEDLDGPDGTPAPDVADERSPDVPSSTGLEPPGKLGTSGEAVRRDDSSGDAPAV